MGASEKMMKKKKAELGMIEAGQEAEIENPSALSKFRISEPLREKLKANGIKALLPIQAMTFDTILDGVDLVGRERTGHRYAPLLQACHFHSMEEPTSIVNRFNLIGVLMLLSAHLAV